MAETHFFSPVTDPLVAQIALANSLMDLAVTFIKTEPDRLQAAVNAALAGGASAADLQPIVDAIAASKTRTDALTALLQSQTAAPAAHGLLRPGGGGTGGGGTGGGIGSGALINLLSGLLTNPPPWLTALLAKLLAGGLGGGGTGTPPAASPKK